jgi:DNA-binding beta-propeller fold protein YncE
MERRLALPLFAAVGLAALTGSVVPVAAQKTAAPGTITTVAGTGEAGFSGDGGPATQARLNFPFYVAIDAAGNLFIAELSGCRVRKVSPEGTISTVAGTGKAGFSGDGGPATQARLNDPHGLAVDRAGNLFISDLNNQRVRKVSPEGMITTVAGNGQLGFSGDGGPAIAARLNWPGGLAVDLAGNLFLADHYNHRIRKVSPDGLITTVAGSGRDLPTKGVSAGDGGLATEARLNAPLGLALDSSGNLFFTELGDVFGVNRGYRVRKVDPNGRISTVAGSDARGFSGDGGPATQARLDTPGGVAVDSAGNLLIVDGFNYRVRMVDRSGMIHTVAGNGDQRYAGDGELATATGLQPGGLVVDAVGNLLFTDNANERVFIVFDVAAPGLIAGEPFPKP